MAASTGREGATLFALVAAAAATLVHAATSAPVAIAAPPAPPGPAPSTPTTASATVNTGRFATVAMPLDVGQPGEGKAPPRMYLQAVARDREGDFRAAAGLYQQAAREWPGDVAEGRDKAGFEAQRSQLLESLSQSLLRGGERSFGLALERARALRLKLMTVRAATGAVDDFLLQATRRALGEALRLAASQRASTSTAELRLLLGATLATAGDARAGRLELAHVPDAEREAPGLALAMATFWAAVGEEPAALDRLRVGLRGQDRVSLREIQLRSDWDQLRGRPAFERLFPAP